MTHISSEHEISDIVIVISWTAISSLVIYLFTFIFHLILERICGVVISLTKVQGQLYSKSQVLRN